MLDLDVPMARVVYRFRQIDGPPLEVFAEGNCFLGQNEVSVILQYAYRGLCRPGHQTVWP